MSEEVDGAGTEVRFGSIEVDAVSLESLKYLSEVLLRCLLLGTGNKDVVYVGEVEGRTSSMKCWKVCAEFLSPKGILTYSNRPKGVLMGVWGISSGLTGIW